MGVKTIVEHVLHVVFALLVWTGAALVLIPCLVIIGLVASLWLLGSVIALPFYNPWRDHSVSRIDDRIDQWERACLEEAIPDKSCCVEQVRVVVRVKLPSAKPEAITMCCNINILRCMSSCEKSPLGNIVLIHGTAGSSMSFAHLFSSLSKRFNVYAIDLPGFGRSAVDVPNAKPLITAAYENPADFYADVLKQILDDLSMDSVYIGGHSFGAYVGLRFASRYQSYVRGLALLNPAGILPTLGGQGVYWGCVFKFSLPNIGRHLGKFGLAVAARAFANNPLALYWYHVMAHPNGFGDRIVSDMITLSPLHAHWHKPAFALIQTLRCPALMIYGADDVIMPPHQGMLVVAVAKGSPTKQVGLKLVRNAGHSPIATIKDGHAVGGEIIQFFDANSNQNPGVNGGLPSGYLAASIVCDPANPTEDIAVDAVMKWSLYKSSFLMSKTFSVIDALYRDLGAFYKVPVEIDARSVEKGVGIPPEVFVDFA